jgi:4-hydroxy-3-polyprenylbenzoate decarboxylase
MDELGADVKVERLPELLERKYGAGVRKGTFVVHSNKDLGATLASGSHQCTGMVIVPCSMKTLAGVALGLSRSLIERAADVMLKEQRKLILVPRETPMSLPALRHQVAAAEAGAMILPAMPAFYQKPQTIDDLADFIAGTILNGLGFEQLGQAFHFDVGAEFVHQQPLAVVGKNEFEVTTAFEQRRDGPDRVDGTAGAGDTHGDLRTNRRRRAHKNTSAAVVAKYSRPTQPLRSKANFTCDKSSARTSDCS